MFLIPGLPSIEYVELAALPLVVLVPDRKHELDGQAFAVTCAAGGPLIEALRIPVLLDQAAERGEGPGELPDFVFHRRRRRLDGDDLHLLDDNILYRLVRPGNGTTKRDVHALISMAPVSVPKLTGCETPPERREATLKACQVNAVLSR
jgi:hypothetical protein